MTAHTLIDAARALSAAVDTLPFAAPVTHVYNPLDYAWEVHRRYLETYGAGRKRVVFVGMNPGPFGMAQIGVPFGEIASARDWLGLEGAVGQPRITNPKRPVEGFACARSEVSGQRLWGLFRARFGAPEAFFAEHFVANYCPLVFFEGGRNLTPDKLRAVERRAVTEACDRHLAAALAALQPEWALGIGGFAERCLRAVLDSDRVDSTLARRVQVAQILHPSPASPAANRGWAEAVDRRLAAIGLLV